MAALAVQDPTPLDPVARITAFMEGFSVEATRPSDADIAALAVLKRGGRVYLSAVPNRPAEESLSAAIRLRAAGFEPVPHIAVRNFVGMAALDDFLARLNDDAGVAHVLVVGGDRAECGPLLRALDAIVGGTLRRRGIGTIGIAGYPEGHPRIGEAELNRALVEKDGRRRDHWTHGRDRHQFCFNAGAILDFIARLRAFGFDHTVRVGLAGPTSRERCCAMPPLRRAYVRAGAGATLGPRSADVRHRDARRSRARARGSARRRYSAFLLLRWGIRHRALDARRRRRLHRPQGGRWIPGRSSEVPRPNSGVAAGPFSKVTTENELL